MLKGRVPLERALSKLGLASRTQARALIREGRVTVDGWGTSRRDGGGRWRRRSCEGLSRERLCGILLLGTNDDNLYDPGRGRQIQGDPV